MLFYLLYVNTQNYIENILNEPVSIVYTMKPTEKIVYDTESDRITSVNLNIANKESINRYNTYAYIRKRHRGFLIEFNDKFMRVDQYENARLTQGNINATTFRILPESEGYTIRSGGMCLTKNSENDGLILEDCACDNCNKSCQLFDFIALDRAFYKTLISIEPDSPLDSADYSEINESDFDLEKKFRQSIFDKEFVDSMKFFYNAAACIQEQERSKQKIENKCKDV